ncbi:Membrane protein involved in colicin uptake-like protein [Pseudomonas amygdali pv. lachrymans]|nr:Membrane protein involved in colicin uptake-like protein [Pseudomonas amygdali pv. lachrymans]RMV57087.1 hypothetical protein ALP09_200084 [Pseudomonas amygdali pv. lachrymans]
MVVESASVKHHAIARNATTLAVIQAAAGKRQTCITDDLPALVDDGSINFQRGSTGAGDSTAGVGQRSCFQVQRAVTAQHALIVIRCPGESQTQCVFCINAASAGVVQLSQIQLNALLSGNHAVLVIQVIGCQQHFAVGQQTPFRAVVELADVGSQGAQTRNFRAAVVQRCSTQIEAIGGNLAAQVGQQLIDAHNESVVAEQRAVRVIQRVGCQCKTVGTGYFTALVVDHVQVFQQQLARRIDQAALVSQQAVAQVEADIAVAIQTAIVGLIQAGDHSAQRHGAGDTTGIAVVDQPCIQLECAGTGQATVLMVVERASGECQTITGNTPALTVIETAADKRQLCITEDLPALVDDAVIDTDRCDPGAADAARAVGQRGCTPGQ